MRSSERGVNSILTTILRFWPTCLRDRIFCLAASDSARQEDHFQKKICPKRTFPSNFVKLVSKILYLFFKTLDHYKKKVCPKRTFPSNFVKLVSKILYLFLAEKNGRLLLFVVAIFWPILAYFFFKLKLSSSWERCFQGKNYTMHGLEIAQPLRYPDSADLPNLQRCNWPNF